MSLRCFSLSLSQSSMVRRWEGSSGLRFFFLSPPGGFVTLFPLNLNISQLFLDFLYGFLIACILTSVVTAHSQAKFFRGCD